jgi:hypothetical protein
MRGQQLRPGKKIRTWILVADGARARLLVNDGPGKGAGAGGLNKGLTNVSLHDLVPHLSEPLRP